jgi:hypothetical protein
MKYAFQELQYSIKASMNEDKKHSFWYNFSTEQHSTKMMVVQQQLLAYWRSKYQLFLLQLY